MTTPSDDLLALDCRKLDFAFTAEDETVLHDVNLQLAQGSRCLLVGANGGAWLVVDRA